MPFRSEKQRRYLWANHPDIAEAWAHGKESSPKRSSRGKRKGRKSRHSRRGGR